MSRLQHVGYFFSRGFGPQGWGRPDWAWGWDWRRPDVYQQAVRELERAGVDLVVMEDAVSLGNPETLDLRVRGAYGGPKHDPLLLAPYLFAATSRIGLAPTVNAGITPPYLAARQAATLQHLSGGRFGLNVVTDTGSARHVSGAPALDHDAAYDRADEWTSLVKDLWRSWEDGALVAADGRYADGTRIRAQRHQGRYFDVTGPLNAAPFDDGRDGEPLVISPGGSPRGLAFAGAYSDVQLAYAPLDVASIRAYRARVHEAARAAGRRPENVRVLFWVKAEVAASREEAERVVAASLHPTDADLLTIAAHWSSDLETDLTAHDLDAPLPPDAFGQHVSRGTLKGLFAGIDDPASTPLRDVLGRRARKGLVAKREGLVGTAEEIADLIEELGEEADNDGVLLSGDLHPVTLHRLFDELVPVLRRRGVLRHEFGDGGARANLFDF
ncbi:Flavin-dependent oxidoreductase, luciferase family (includes alkanesulfonate monooxygenase SsuD and methylene tetrahydromethanopterin reductase) [Quadrisphaera granulorum]|uniref:Alkanesulfonate monooxygenase SsuD/methylene tetrahydromethanopterin reductase-like flavin-dependent oxidoreductase (Luciferase family) n=1 Tax=Quadrisphaera granulorum TaxID=317664 RepID=A0A315ZU28_9ACTN|nr:LLM class flavin-dependent oxidoreductase [Quadrisphaera granulorum]PWJ49061.1 alkanesulfonate monooxygenase SsuD/methylene tetrahydromethanopterin reductase-like flavin-dependent oxidoreductase (luciferase family) [Quadrisphaera granulorum]SZE98271.1 Flavin-dependent oxidoreductase, luciferase family (includes alkanesulfonate monooxygenase SsuD and methylene tetrahydromethanopterin reductase) [Quadrisphaera granulorum]